MNKATWHTAAPSQRVWVFARDKWKPGIIERVGRLKLGCSVEGEVKRVTRPYGEVYYRGKNETAPDFAPHGLDIIVPEKLKDSWRWS